MSVLASLAADSRTDGGTGLQRLLRKAKFDERTRLSLTKHTADDLTWSVVAHQAA
jgi:hypothetical protein